MNPSLDIILMLDIYGDLLSSTQREALDMRYNADLSLAEIAEEMGGITRQSVLCSIKKGEQRLTELESKLGFAKRLKSAAARLDDAQRIIAEIKGEYPDERLNELSRILDEVKGEL